jgi:hypothetical protein
LPPTSQIATLTELADGVGRSLDQLNINVGAMVAETTEQFRRLQNEFVLPPALPVIAAELMQRMDVISGVEQAVQSALALPLGVEPPTRHIMSSLQAIAETHQQQMAGILRSLAVAQPFQSVFDAMPLTLAFSEHIHTHLAQVSQALAGLSTPLAARSKQPSQEHLACARATQAMHAEDMQVLRQFTVETLRLPSSSVFAVAEALWEGRWRRAERPIAYVRRVAWRNHFQAENGRPSKRADHQPPVSLDQPTNAGNPLGDVLPDPYNPLPLVEVLADLQRVCRRPGIPSDIYPLLRARMEGEHRADLGAYLGWSQQRVETAWRWVNRNRERLAAGLSLIRYSCPRFDVRATHEE